MNETSRCYSDFSYSHKNEYKDIFAKKVTTHFDTTRKSSGTHVYAVRWPVQNF